MFDKTINKLPSEEFSFYQIVDSGGREEKIVHVYTLYYLHCVKPSKVGVWCVKVFKVSTVLFDMTISA